MTTDNLKTPWLNLVVAAWMLLAASVSQAQPKAPAAANGEPAPPVLRLEANGPVSRVSALAFSPDGKTLYTAGWDKVVYVYMLNKTGQFELVKNRTLRIPIGPGQNGAINALAVSGDGRHLAVAGQGMGSHVSGFLQNGLIWPSSAQSKEQWLNRGTIHVFDLATNQVTPLTGHAGPVIGLSFAPSQAGQPLVLVSAGEDYNTETGTYHGAVRVWNVQQPQQPVAVKLELPAPRKQQKLPRSIAVARMGADGKSLRVAIAWGDDQLRLWDVAANRTTVAANPYSSACAFVENQLLLAGGHGNEGGKLGLWSLPANAAAVPTLKTNQLLPEGKFPTGLATFSRNAQTPTHALTTYLHQGAMGFFLIDLQTLKPVSPAVPIPAGGHLPAFAASADGSFVAGNADQQIQIFRVADLLNNQPAPHQVLDSEGDVLARVRLFRKGEALGLALNRTRQNNADQPPDLILDLETDRIVADPAGWALPPSKTAGWTVNVGKDGNRPLVEVTLPGGNPVKILLAEDQQVLDFSRCPATENHPPLIALAIDRVGEPMLNVYNAQTGDRLRRLEGHTARITGLAFSDDGKLLASAAQDRTVCVWWMEELKSVVNQRGLLHGLSLRSAGETVVVNEVGETAQAALKNALQEGDVILGLFRKPEGQPEELIAVTKAHRFFYHVSLKKPGEDVALQVRRGDGPPQRVTAKVQQAVDERKPLFSLLFAQDDQTKTWSWIGWNPLGPFESSDQQIEKLVGWHFNTGDAKQPARFAELAEYREKHFGKGLLKGLIEAGKVPADWPPVPAPQMSLLIREGEDDPLLADEERRVRVRSNNVRAILDLANFPAHRISQVVWQVEDSPKQALTRDPRNPNYWLADLSRFNWKRGPNALRISLTTNASVPQEYASRQEIVYDPAAPPPPAAQPGPIGDESPLNQVSLPRVSIIDPLPGTALIEGQDRQSAEVSVRLIPVGQPQACELTFQVNGQTLQRGGQAVVKKLDGTEQTVKETLPLSPGENQLRVRLSTPDNKRVEFSESITVRYQRPPLVVDVAAKVDQKTPRATLTCVIKTPEDRPLQAIQFAVNEQIASLPPESIQVKRRANDNNLWDVVATGLPLTEGANPIRVLPRNGDGPALKPGQVATQWMKPVPKPPTVDFVNVSDQSSVATYRPTVKFQVVAEASLDRVDAFLNGKHVANLAIPRPNDGIIYPFELAVQLDQTQNVLKVIAKDKNSGQIAREVPLSVVNAPVTVLVDRVVVPRTEQNERQELAAKPTPAGVVVFSEPAKAPRVFLQGRLLVPSGTQLPEVPYVKCWVNGFLQTKALINPVDGTPNEFQFAASLLLNRKTENSLEVVLADVPTDKESRTRCRVDCDHPETRQRLNLILVGIDPTKPRGIDPLLLWTQAKKAFRITETNTAPGFDQVEPRVLTGWVKATQVHEHLLRMRYLAHGRGNQALNEVSLFYYQGREVRTDEGEFILVTSENARNPERAGQKITRDYLTNFLNDVPGAHLIFLDVAHGNQSIAAKWPADPHTGVLRTTHAGVEVVPPGFPLVAALDNALPQVATFQQVPKLIKAFFKQKASAAPLVDDHVPEELEGLIVGEPNVGR